MSNPKDAMQTMINNLPEKTGKALNEWLKIIDKSKLVKHGEIMKLLKGEYGVSHGFANLITAKAKEQKGGGAEPDDLVTQQYSKGKEDLKPIYEKILKAVEKFGPDLEVAPKKSYVSLRRTKQFALIQPSTKTRVDIGINLQGEAAQGRLEVSGSFNKMVSHRIRVSDNKDVDSEVIAWLKQAYSKA